MPNKLKIFLADDDPDDCLFFKEAIDSFPLSTTLTVVNDGEQLMEMLNSDKLKKLPDVLFLDFNMPRKNGFECLTEIKKSSKLKSLPVAIFSTSFEVDIVDLLYEKGAHFYIRKPPQFPKLKQIIHQTLTVISEGVVTQPSKESFILTVAT